MGLYESDDQTDPGTIKNEIDEKLVGFKKPLTQLLIKKVKS